MQANKESSIIFETEESDNGLLSNYATLYKRDYYVQMNNNDIKVGKTKERNHGKLVWQVWVKLVKLVRTITWFVFC